MGKKVVVIGGGPGGYSAAFVLAQTGAEVTLIEKDKLGGTCLNRGCVPTKVLLHAVQVIREIRNSQRIGITIPSFDLNFPRMTKQKDDLVASLAIGLEGLCKSRNVRLVKGTGLFEAPQKIRVKETGQLIEGDKVLIAPGSVPATISVKGSNVGDMMTSDEALQMEKIPSSILIIGGGYIGLEFAQVFNVLGARVTVIELLHQILPNEDRDVASALNGALSKEGITIYTGAVIEEIQKKKRSHLVRFAEKGRRLEIETSLVLMAVGRRPSTENLGLEKVGVKTERGRILVDGRMRTSTPGIYAVGDAIGRLMLAHAAAAEGIAAAEHILGQGHDEIDYSAIPRCIYTYPEAASVGLTEARAREIYGEVTVSRAPLQAMAKARILDGMGFAKIISEKKFKKVVGIHLVGPHVTDLIAEGALAMNLECTVEEIAYTVHPHPTLSEVMMEAAMSASGLRIHSP